jgi:multidrug efflux system outer membrane protein
LRYRGGIESFLEDLTARRALYTAEISLANTQQLRASNLVALYRSLGGDPFEGAPASAYDNHSQ